MNQDKRARDAIMKHRCTLSNRINIERYTQNLLDNYTIVNEIEDNKNLLLNYYYVNYYVNFCLNTL